MAIKYQMAVTKSGDYGRYLGLDGTMALLRKRISPDGGVRIIKGEGNDPGPILTRFEAFKRGRVYLLNAKPGDKLTVLPDTGPHNWTVRVADYDPTPESFLAGVPSIDRIIRDVYGRFNDQYGITNLGICASKPGEHSKCNAIDIGVSRPKTADAIHAAILEIGNYLRNRMLADIQGEPGLPVNGVIVMEQVSSREGTNWNHYGGVPHVSHVHVSGWPNLVPGWV